MKPLTRKELIASGYDITPLTREEKFLKEAMCECEEGGGSNLPKVDSTDNGKVLTVVDGAWSAASASGGGTLKITMSDNDIGGEPVRVLDKTYEEITSAINQGILPLCTYADDTDVMVYIVTECWTANAEGTRYYVSVGGFDFRSDSASGVLYFVL